MKKIAIFSFILLTGCVRMSVESTVSACSVTGLRQVSFYEGDIAGNPLPYAEKSAARVWDIPGSGERVYVRCFYDGGAVTTQIIPATVTQCRAEENPDGGILKLSCRARL